MPTDPTLPEPLTRELREEIREVIRKHALSPTAWHLVDAFVERFVAPLVERVTRAEEECGRLTRENTAARASLALRAGCVEALFASLRAQVAALTADRDTLIDRLSEMDREIVRLVEDAMGAEYSEGMALADVADHENTIATLRTALAAAQGEGERLRAALEAIKGITFEPWRRMEDPEHTSPLVDAIEDTHNAAAAALARPGGTEETT